MNLIERYPPDIITDASRCIASLNSFPTSHLLLTPSPHPLNLDPGRREEFPKWYFAA